VTSQLKVFVRWSRDNLNPIPWASIGLAEKFDTAVEVNHHARKALSEGAIEAVAGTGGVAAAADTVLLLTRKSDGEATLEVIGREEEEKTFALRFHQDSPFGWRLIGEGEELAMSAEQLEVISLLRDEGQLTPVQIAVELGKSRSGVRMMLKRMAADGKVEKAGKVYRQSQKDIMSMPAG